MPRPLSVWCEVVAVFAVALLLAALCGPPATGAPALPAKPDVVIGQLVKQADGPVVELPGDETATYWLVFERPADESRLAGFETGTRVRVGGKPAAGGTYRYVIVSTIDPDD